MIPRLTVYRREVPDSEVIDLTDSATQVPQSVGVAGDDVGPESYEDDGSGFFVHLEEFAGPFDVLLNLISKHKLEVTELALNQVTDEFCAYIRQQGSEWDLAEATSFLVVAATLLDLKAARLLPSGEVEDEEDLALLEARDLLFARLLQYRAFKEMAGVFEQSMARNVGRLPRTVGVDPEFADLLPDVVFGIGPERFAELAARALTPPEPSIVSIDHIHAPPVSVAEQTQILAGKLERVRSATFRALIADTTEIAVIVARFLGLLELFRQGRIQLDQVAALGDLTVRWTADEASGADVEATSEFDEEDDKNQENADV